MTVGADAPKVVWWEVIGAEGVGRMRSAPGGIGEKFQIQEKNAGRLGERTATVRNQVLLFSRLVLLARNLRPWTLVST